MAVLPAAACGEPEVSTGTSSSPPAFGGIFSLEDEIHLDDDPHTPIADPLRLEETSDGQLLLVDKFLPRVRKYLTDGTLTAGWGRFGSGPFEFRRISAATQLPSSRVAVVDPHVEVVTFLSADLEPLERIPVPSPPFAVERFASGMMVGLLAEGPSEDVFHAFSEGGDFLWSGYPHPERLFTEPYWASIGTTVTTAASQEWYIATSLFYPISAYSVTGRLVDAFGFAPPSFKEVRSVPPGAFTAGIASPRFAEWISEATVIDRMVTLNDTLLVVVHAHMVTTEYEILGQRQYALDVYDLRTRSKLLEDVDIPPALRIVGGGAYIYTLKEDPVGFPIGRWILDDAALAK